MKGRLRWWIIGLVTLGTVLNYLARSTLSVAAPTLKAEFSMSTADYSWVVLAFQASYTVMQSVAGAVLDALGTRVGFAIFALGWALANMAHALATGALSLAMFRALLGATEAAAIPAGSKAVSEWFPPRERPLATSVFQMGTSVGNILAPPLVAFCILWWGWRSAFVVTGTLSLAWVALWWWGYRTPAEHKRLGASERAYIGEQGAPDDVGAKPATRKDVLKSRRFWAIAIPRFLAEPAWQTFNFFIPLYLVAAWKLDLKSIALWAWLPFLAADFGSLAAGLLPPWLMKRGSGLLAGRALMSMISWGPKHDVAAAPMPYTVSVGKITIPLTWVNSADDFINPPELPMARQDVKRIKLGKFVLIPAGPDTHGHGTHTWAAFWKDELAALLKRSE